MERFKTYIQGVEFGPFYGISKVSLYIEWKNSIFTLEGMADFYGVNWKDLRDVIAEGQELYKTQQNED